MIDVRLLTGMIGAGLRSTMPHVSEILDVIVKVDMGTVWVRTASFDLFRVRVERVSPLAKTHGDEGAQA